MTEDLFDARGFALRVRHRMADENLSLRQLQAKIGVDQASIHRVSKKELPPSVETYLRLERWLSQGVIPVCGRCFQPSPDSYPCANCATASQVPA